MFKRSIFVLTLIVFLFASPQQGAASHEIDPAAHLTIDNFINGQTLEYDLPLLKGTAPGSGSITIQGNGWTQQAAVSDGRWRAFVLLKKGSNLLTLTSSEGYQLAFNLYYHSPITAQKVRMVYVLGSDSAGGFDAPAGIPNTKADAVKRMKVAARMLQSMTAELLYEKGLPRRTFQLVTDDSGEPVVDIAVVTYTVAQLRTMDGMSLWYYFYDSLSGIPDRNNIKDIAIIADSHYDQTTGTTQASTALGGGRLALFGNLIFYAWPESIAEIESHFTDPTTIPTGVFPEYSRAYQLWATYTTSIGAVLHEFGHCVGLDHPQDPQTGDVMYRGFDFLNRMAVTYEPGYGSIDPTSAVMSVWTDDDAAILLSN